MMITVANPIYDAVFKYLMEDERIARTLLSALLKKKVLQVNTRRHEYTNGTRDNISMFRIDFAAQVLQDDGSVKLVLIELQKTWLDTETLRFRQYLGAQYQNPENIVKEDNPQGYATPMVAVYMLGHRVGDIEEPVIYVNHHSYNYEGQVVTKGIPDPFVESLIHNSIIIQLPLLHGQINNRLEKVLSVFDQSRKDENSRQIMRIDESLYADDADMLYILHRLTSAAADAKLRQDMNVEDEYFSAIEKRDTEIMLRDKRIEAQTIELVRQECLLEAQHHQLTEQQNQLTEQQNQLTEQQNQLTEQQNQLTEQQNQLLKERQKLHSLVSALVSNGMSEEQISAMTGYSIDEINSCLGED